MKHLILPCLFITLFITTHAQPAVDEDWNAFAQSINIAPYRGGRFRFKGFVRVEKASRISNARLWARVDKKKGTAFFYNMVDRPIMDSTWREYTIEGDIDPRALKLVIGGLYFGAARYYFDKFSVEVKLPDSDWHPVKLNNPDFESDTYAEEWKTFYKREGFKSTLTDSNPAEGDKALLVDATSRKVASKFVTANNISIHYQEFGKGDTLLLLHGNSESLQSFSKQIPELSKYFYVIAMDSRGQGLSSRDDRKYTYELMADDVVAFLDALSINRVNIVGWSDGGNIGLIVAMNNPHKVKKLAVMGANLYNDETAIEPKINRILRKRLTALKASNKPSDKFGLEMTELLLYEPRINPDSLAKIQCPTLVMAGSKDMIKEGHTKLIASKIKDSKLTIFNPGTHYAPLQIPEKFNAAVVEFMK